MTLVHLLLLPASYLAAYAIGKRMRERRQPPWRSYVLALLPALALAAAETLRLSPRAGLLAFLVWMSWAALGTDHAWRAGRKPAAAPEALLAPRKWLSGRDPL